AGISERLGRVKLGRRQEAGLIPPHWSRSREGPLTAHLAHCPSPRRRSRKRTDSRRSGRSVGTGQNAPYGTVAVASSNRRAGWEAALADEGTITSAPPPVAGHSLAVVTAASPRSCLSGEPRCHR